MKKRGRKRRIKRREKKVYFSGCHYTATAGEKWRVVVIITAVVCYRCVIAHVCIKGFFLNIHHIKCITDRKKAKKRKDKKSKLVFRMHNYTIFLKHLIRISWRS
jgi:hypothetical protein